MRWTVNFDDETQREANEIGEVGADGMLTSKAKIQYLFAPQTKPEFVFRERLCVAKLARTYERLSGGC